MPDADEPSAPGQNPPPGDGDRGARLSLGPGSAESALATLVLTVVELLRQLIERQALRRVDVGDLTDQQIEEIGRTLMALEEQMAKLCEHFGITPGDLNIDLGPLGPLLPPS
jgi:Gas vesicle protein K